MGCHRRKNGTGSSSRGQMKCDGTRAKTTFCLSAKRTSPFKSAGASVQSTTGSRGVRISGSNDGYTMFRGNVKGTGYPLHSPVSPSLPLPLHRASPCAITFQIESSTNLAWTGPGTNPSLCRTKPAINSTSHSTPFDASNPRT